MAGTAAVGYAHAIKIEALAQLGTMLKGMTKNVGAKGIGTSAVPKGNHTPTYADLGVDKKTAMVAQRLQPWLHVGYGNGYKSESTAIALRHHAKQPNP